MDNNPQPNQDPRGLAPPPALINMDILDRKTDPQLREGPVKQRVATNQNYCYTMIGCWVVFFIILFLGLMLGSPSKLISFYDTDGNICGYDAPVADYPYIYFPSFDENKLFTSICVSECPRSGDTEAYCHPTKKIPSCKDGDKIKGTTLKFSVYPTVLIQDRVCFPTDEMGDNSDIFNEFSHDAHDFDIVLQEVYKYWPYIVVSIPVAILISILYLYMLKQCTAVMVWGLIIGLAATVMGIGFAMIGIAAYGQSELSDQPSSFDSDIDLDAYYYAGAFIIAIGIGILILCCCCIMRVRLTIAIVKTTAEYVQDTPKALAIAPAMFLIVLFSLTLQVFAVVYIWTSGRLRKGSEDQIIPIANIELGPGQGLALFFMTIFFYWTSYFYVDLPKMLISGSTCIWYWSDDGEEKDKSVDTSVDRTMRYNIGSVAMGSLLRAIISILRGLCQGKRRNDHHGGGGQMNTAPNFALCCLQCCCACIEVAILYVAEQSYIHVAMTGHDLVDATKTAVGLVYRNFYTFAFVGGMGQSFAGLGTIFIAALTGLVGWSFLGLFEDPDDESAVPIVIFFVYFFWGIIIGSNFMSIYGNASQAIIHCYCMDQEIRQQTGQDLKAPRTLQEFIRENMADGQPLL